MTTIKQIIANPVKQYAVHHYVRGGEDRPIEFMDLMFSRCSVLVVEEEEEDGTKWDTIKPYIQDYSDGDYNDPTLSYNWVGFLDSNIMSEIPKGDLQYILDEAEKNRSREKEKTRIIKEKAAAKAAACPTK